MPKRTLQGVVTSDKMDKTVTVSVERRIKHPLYKKYIKRNKKYAAHDEKNEYKVGQTVMIQECKPISKRKTWEVTQAVDVHAQGTSTTKKKTKTATKEEAA